MNLAIPDARTALRGSAIRYLALVVLVSVAYHQSLLSLLRNLALDTPLAYLGLVPMIAIGLAVVLTRRADMAPPIHDRQLDFIIGLPLLGVAALSNYVLPAKFSTLYWVWRIDMLTLPIFVAGAAVLIFGTRATWKARLPIGFLFLAWPYPYTLALFRWLDGFTTITIKVLSRAVAIVPWAIHDPTGDGSRFAIGSGAKKFTVSVASQCSGANGLLGFLLVGGALMALVKGPRLGKFSWLLVGAVVTWMLNVVRIMFIFFIGRTWGEKVAIDGFHPFIGMVLFNVGIITLVLVMRRFRLNFPGRAAARQSPSSGTLSKVVLPKLRFALPIALSAVMIVGSLNAKIVRYSLVASDLGVPRLSSFASAPPTISDWAPTTKGASYDWARRFFGDDSTWNRFWLAPPTETTGKLWGNTPILADVITGSSVARLNAYGIEACYKFHGYNLADQVSVDLGGGVKGTSLRWKDGDGPVYTTVYWHWPVLEDGKRRFERVTLLLGDRGSTAVAKTDVDFGTLSSRIEGALTRGDLAVSKVELHNQELRSYLVSVARELVAGQQVAPVQATR
jgi:exosortase/archaeosortase family protein